MVIHKKKSGDYLFDIINITFMFFMVVITLYPFLYVIFASLSEPKLFLAHTGALIKPLGFSLSSYEAVFRNPNIKTGYFNTIYILVIGTILNLLITAIGAYVLSRKGPMLKGPIMFIIVLTMFIDGGLVPNYLLIKELGLYNSRWSLILPGLVSTYNLIVMRTGFESIPESLEESARIDGATDITILFKIIIPLSIPTMAVIGLFYAVNYWNAWFNAMIYLKDKALFPLQLILRDIIIQSQMADMTTVDTYTDRYAVSQTIKYATIMVATVPILILYPFLQKYFVKGVMIGAVKG